MATVTSHPNADVTTLWPLGQPVSPTTHWTRWDDPISGATDSDFNACGDIGKVERCGFDDNGPIYTITRVDVVFRVLGQALPTPPGITFLLWNGFTLVGLRSVNVNTAGAWKNLGISFTGLSLSQADYNNLEVQLVSVDGSPLGDPDFEEL